MQWRLSKSMTILLMVPLVSAYSFSLDLYIPLLPTIQTAMQVSRLDMQLTNSLFMLCCGVGQLMFGPISDRYGRRPVLFVSLSLSIIANLICLNSHVYSVFLMGKLLQAIGACGSYLCCFATVRDLYHQPEQSTEMFSYLNIANSVSAIIAPSIGTQIGNHFGWPYIFLALMFYALYSLIVCSFFYAETAPALVKNSPKPKSQVLMNYWRVFTHINYQVYTLPAALGVSSFFAFYSISPYLYQQTFGLSKLSYSILFGSCGLTFFVGSYLCGWLVTRIGIIRTMVLGLGCHALGCLIIIVSSLLVFNFQLVVIHFSVLLIIWGSALMVSSGIGGTMAPFQDIAGSAFALISAYKFMMCYLLGEIVMSLYDNTAVPLGVLLLGINLFSSLILFVFRNSVQSTSQKMENCSKMSAEMSKSIDNIL